jgi:pimeloyl-ACP methyl ester carboxylesterase
VRGSLEHERAQRASEGAWGWGPGRTEKCGAPRTNKKKLMATPSNRAALVLIPGLQGRWEYMRRTVGALSKHFQVLTFSLCNTSTMDAYVDQVVRTLDENHIRRAVVAGVSFGGVVALRFAAAHPVRTGALVLASTPGPGWHLRPRHRAYSHAPWIFGPLFLLETPWRLRAEFEATFPDAGERRAFKREALRTVLMAPISLSRMAARARLLNALDLGSDCGLVTAPTLVVTGERELDHVVPADESSQYARLIPDARMVTLERTGHLGTITRPDAFAEIVHAFVGADTSVDRGAA